jgi:uncharacterized protein YecE (DUF72 family)
MVKLLTRVFDFVEIDSSFYRIPNAFMAKNWSKKTPTHFRFTAKFPKVITHDKRLRLIQETSLGYVRSGVTIHIP